MRRFIASTGFLLLTIFVAQSVPAAESSPSRGVIEEIVVTAQKREQNIQDVGISMAAYSGDQLQSLGIDGIEGLAGDIPNVQLFELSGGGVPIVVIRGVGLNNFRINDSPTTGVYVDEVYQVSIAQLGSTLFDIERVEVLKGPQGGLYGRNAVGGAIRYLSKKPSFEQNESYATVGYGRFAKREAEGGFGGPISDVLAVRISGRIVKSDDTVFESPIGGFDHGEEDRWAARAMLSFQPSDTFSLDLKLHGGGDQSELPLMRPIGAYEPGVPTFIPGVTSSRLAGDFCSSFLAGGREPNRCVITSGETPESLGVYGRYDGATLRRPRLDSDWWGLNLIGVWASDNYTVKSITAYDQLDYLRRTDQDAGPLAQQEITYVSDIGSWSQELHVTYDAGGAVTGLFGFTYSQDTLEETTFLDGSEGLFTFVFGTDSVENPYEQDTQAFAAFGRVDWMFADDWNVGVEARYTTEDKEFSGGTFFVDQGNFVN
ncbi:MAG: TonB-dependent receptor, partial [Gammaproteobacteria bacterium]|nr:TonB-dependent receptor [Gammaproteobacteria bacterium]